MMTAAILADDLVSSLDYSINLSITYGLILLHRVACSKNLPKYLMIDWLWASYGDPAITTHLSMTRWFSCICLLSCMKWVAHWIETLAFWTSLISMNLATASWNYGALSANWFEYLLKRDKMHSIVDICTCLSAWEVRLISLSEQAASPWSLTSLFSFWAMRLRDLSAESLVQSPPSLSE